MLDEECDEPEEKLTKRQLRNAEKIDPSLPGQKAGISTNILPNLYRYCFFSCCKIETLYHYRSEI